RGGGAGGRVVTEQQVDRLLVGALVDVGAGREVGGLDVHVGAVRDLVGDGGGDLVRRPDLDRGGDLQAGEGDVQVTDGGSGGEGGPLGRGVPVRLERGDGSLPEGGGVAGLRCRNSEGGQGQGAGDGGHGGAYTHAFPLVEEGGPGSGRFLRLVVGAGPRLIVESVDSKDQIRGQGQWVYGKGKSCEGDRSRSVEPAVPSQLLGAGGVFEQRRHLEPARPLTGGPGETGGDPLQGGRVQDPVRCEPPVGLHAVHDEFLVLDVGGRGARSEQHPHRLRHLVFGALGTDPAGHRLAEPPHLEQLGEVGGAPRGDRQQRHARGERQQVGGVGDDRVGGVHHPHLPVDD